MSKTYTPKPQKLAREGKQASGTSKVKLVIDPMPQRTPRTMSRGSKKGK